MVGGIIFSLLPDKEISDDTYQEVALIVAACPAAQRTLDAMNVDHKILSSENRVLRQAVVLKIKEDEKATKLQNIKVAKGLLKAPLQKRTCSALPEEKKK